MRRDGIGQSADGPKDDGMTIPSLDIDFYSDAVILDPYPVYAKMRDMGPVVYLPHHDLYWTSDGPSFTSYPRASLAAQFTANVVAKPVG